MPRLVMMQSVTGAQRKARVLVAGGGIAGIEALLAIRDMAGDRAELTLVSAEPDFVYRPLMVEEPFGADPAERRELEPAARELGAEFRLAALESVDPSAHEVRLSDGSSAGYEHLVVCLGGRYRPAFAGVTTFPSPDHRLTVEKLLTEAHVRGGDGIDFVVPPGVGWSLPLYELALMTGRRARERGHTDLAIRLITPEDSPLGVFGTAASQSVAELLEARGIEARTGALVHERDGELVITPGDEPLGQSAVVALPGMRGPAVEGLPSDDDGFIPIDEHARVRGADDVYAAGDGTTFPLKQGGLATQQADAAAAHIAHTLGAPVEAEPFRPVLRGKLLTGEESLNLAGSLTGGGGEGEASLDPLWWPPQKVSGRYLAAWLSRSEVTSDPGPPPHGLDVEVELPKEWHSEPMDFG